MKINHADNKLEENSEKYIQWKSQTRAEVKLLVFQGHRELLRHQWVRISEVKFELSFFFAKLNSTKIYFETTPQFVTPPDWN